MLKITTTLHLKKLRSFSLSLLTLLPLYLSPNLTNANPKAEHLHKVWIAAGDTGTYSAIFNSHTGSLESITAALPNVNGYFISSHPSKPIIYVAGREDKKSLITTVDVGSAKPQITDSLINLPNGVAHIASNDTGSLLSSAYYRAGVTGVYTLSTDGKRIIDHDHFTHTGNSVHSRQKSPHSHWTGFSPDNRFLYSVDLGTDEIWVFEIITNSLASKEKNTKTSTNQNKSTLKLIQKAKGQAGAGPRHLSFDWVNHLAYVSDELMGRVSRYHIDVKTGKLTYLDSTLPATEASKEAWFNASDIQRHPNGDFIYLAQRGFDRISAFKVLNHSQPPSKSGTKLIENTNNKTLELIEHEPVRGSIVRHMQFDPTGKWLLALGRESNTVAVFRVDGQTGELQFKKPVYAIPSPMAITFINED